MKRSGWLWLAHGLACLAVGASLSCGETFEGGLLVRPSWTHSRTNATTVTETFSTLFNWVFASGHSTNQMDQLWVKRQALTNAQAMIYNLAGGITNSFGTVLDMNEVRMLAIISDDDNAHPVTVGGAAANVFSTWAGAAAHTLTLRPGGIVLLVAPDVTGYAVGTNGNLKVTNTGTNAVTIDLYVGGASQ